MDIGDRHSGLRNRKIAGTTPFAKRLSIATIHNFFTFMRP